MAIQCVWSDEYQGPRYIYHSPLRPLLPTMLPNGYTAVIAVGQNARIVITTEPLPDDFIAQWSLERVDQPTIPTLGAEERPSVHIEAPIKREYRVTVIGQARAQYRAGYSPRRP